MIFIFYSRLPFSSDIIHTIWCGMEHCCLASTLVTPSTYGLVATSVGCFPSAIASSLYVSGVISDEAKQLVSTYFLLTDMCVCMYMCMAFQDDSQIGTSHEEVISSDPVKYQQSNKPKDFIIFVNIVDFCHDLLPMIHTKLFEKWIFTFGHQLIIYSTTWVRNLYLLVVMSFGLMF